MPTEAMKKPKLFYLPAVEIFSTGTTNVGDDKLERKWTAADLDAMVRNFNIVYRARPKKLFQPPVKLGHETDQGVFQTMRSDWPAAGWITGLRRDGEVLVATVSDVEPKTAEWIAAKKFKKVSSEILDEPPAALREAGCKGPFLQAVGFLGSAPPEVKGLSDLPMPVMLFTRKTTRAALRLTGRRGIHLFAEVIMDRAAMLDRLSTLGFDIAVITDGVPDEVVAELLRVLEATAAATAASEAAAQGGQAAGQAAAAAGGTSSQAGDRQPSQVTMKFADFPEAAALITTVDQLKRELAETKRAAADQTTIANQQREKDKEALVRTFCERMVNEGKLIPAEVEVDPETKKPRPRTVLEDLLRRDHNRLHVFSEGKSTVQRTDLERAMEMIEARPAHLFSEKIKAGANTAVADRFKKIRDDRKAEMELRAGGAKRKSLHEKLNLLPSRSSR